MLDTTPEAERLAVEELANCITHGFGLMLSLVGFVALLLLASLRGDVLHIVGTSIYGASLVILYLASTLYHSARRERSKHFLQVVDHCCIYLLIAGTYTPFTLVILRGGWGWTLFGLAWGLAVAGILFRILFGNCCQGVTIASYLLLGWLCVIAIKPILTAVPAGAIEWLVAGGLAYSSGVIFLSWKRVPHHHAIWHLFVLGGSICHYMAILLYVLPLKG
jgi:hemolysin III